MNKKLNTVVTIFLLSIQYSTVAAQDNISLCNLNAFKNPEKSWTLAANVFADLEKENVLHTEKGTGILANIPTKKTHGADLFTVEEYGDIDLECDYMMATNSNSGIYLQSRYEIQLRDSWGVQQPSASDNGGIYGQYPPRTNTSRAPGLWQHLYISFRSPRFDASGRKIENAKILQMALNGTVIHENVELPGPTAGAIEHNEVAKAALRIQGDHGAVAFKNLRITHFYGEQPELSNLKYHLYEGKFEFIPDYSEYEPAEHGTLEKFGTAFLSRESDFLIRFTANVTIKQAGNYIFQRETNGGGYVKIDNKLVSDLSSYVTTPVYLEPGVHALEAGYTKPYNWFPTSFGLKISANNIREYLVSDATSLSRNFPDPVIISPVTYPVMRSFIDLSNGKRVVHAISAGSIQQLHYSYDLDNGSLFQSWRGGFLDATNMWVGRGDGSAKPLGSIIQFNNSRFPVVQLNSPESEIKFDTTSSGFVNLGYELAKDNKTIFSYKKNDVTVNDAIQIAADGKSVGRSFSVSNNPGNLYFAIAEGNNIETLPGHLYLIDGKSYYIKLKNIKPDEIIRQSGGRSILLAPLNDQLSYSILF